MVLDLKEPALEGMGPHDLVVGATGSGKSALLRTLVWSPILRKFRRWRSVVRQEASLSGPQFNGYLRRPIPDELDELVERIVQAYSQEAPASRTSSARSGLGGAKAETLNAYAQRMAVASVRSGSTDLIRLGLIALGMATALDVRENVIVLSLLSHSAEILEASYADLVEKVARVVPAQAMERFRAFARRSAKDRDIRAMGYGTEGSGATFSYVHVSPWT